MLLNKGGVGDKAKKEFDLEFDFRLMFDFRRADDHQPLCCEGRER